LAMDFAEFEMLARNHDKQILRRNQSRCAIKSVLQHGAPAGKRVVLFGQGIASALADKFLKPRAVAGGKHDAAAGRTATYGKRRIYFHGVVSPCPGPFQTLSSRFVT